MRTTQREDGAAVVIAVALMVCLHATAAITAAADTIAIAAATSNI